MLTEGFGERYKLTEVEQKKQRDILTTWYPLLETGLKRLVDFAKALVDFQGLPTEDQVELIKCKRSEERHST